MKGLSGRLIYRLGYGSPLITVEMECEGYLWPLANDLGKVDAVPGIERLRYGPRYKRSCIIIGASGQRCWQRLAYAGYIMKSGNQ